MEIKIKIDGGEARSNVAVLMYIKYHLMGGEARSSVAGPWIQISRNIY